MSDGAPPSGQPMEDILASIKRIITDEASAARAPAAWPREEHAAEEDVLELGTPAPAPPPPTQAAVPAPMPPTAAATAPVPAPAPTSAAPSHIPAAAAPDALVSAETSEASRQALASLAVLKVDADAPAGTLDGLVREMLRPMLKDWLDANLPDLVERIVTREVARLTGR